MTIASPLVISLTESLIRSIKAPAEQTPSAAPDDRPDAADGTSKALSEALIVQSAAEIGSIAIAPQVAAASNSNQPTNKADNLKYGGGRQVVHALGGSDEVRGGGGKDDLYGDGGHDKLWGQGGDDLLDGGPGNDVLRGGPGRDRIFGNGGNSDKLFGQGGADVFYLKSSNSAQIKDFNANVDKIVLLPPGNDGAIPDAPPVSSGTIPNIEGLFYNQRTGALLYDSDGSGPSRPRKIAELPTGLNPGNIDFLLYAPGSRRARLAPSSGIGGLIQNPGPHDPQSPFIGLSVAPISQLPPAPPLPIAVQRL